MEEFRPARRSSGIQDVDYGSTQSLGSAASLRDHAVDPAGSRFSEGAGFAHTTPAGVVPPGSGGETIFHDSVEQAPAPAPQPAAPAVPFYKKRWFIISQLILIPLAIALLFILLFPVVRAIVQLVIKRTQLDIESAIITQPQNNTFQLTLQGNATHTGIISAKIEFLEPVDISWFEDDFTETKLGSMTFQPLFAKHKRAPINATSTFTITDEDAFGRFSAQLITAPNFTWHMKSQNLRVHALKFPVAKGLTFDKNLTMTGFNSFNDNVVLKDLQLPSDNPAGGIDFRAVTELNNPSPFSLNLGTVVFSLAYKNVTLGIGTGVNNVINPGPNDITLVGFMKRQTTPETLAVVSELFTNYLNGESSPVIATGVSTLQSDNSSISWLSKGLQSLALNVPFKSFNEINPIRSITIGNLGLDFDENAPWTPGAESNSVQAMMQLPFGFNMAIDQIQNDFTIVAPDGANVAGLATPLGASKSTINVLGPADTQGSINISISNTNLSCPDPQHPAFSKFNADLTSLDAAQFRLVGSSRAVANTSLGQITLNAIKVNVSTSLHGLKGLKGLTTIQKVDVTGGTTDAINLGIEVAIFNPSDLDLSTGDLTLQLSRDGVALGTALIPDLVLKRGNNTFHSTSNFKANDSPQGQQTLNDFVGKKDVQLNIAGFNGSTKIASLAEAFGTLNVDVILPGLKTNLIDTADLKSEWLNHRLALIVNHLSSVLSTTGRTNNISHVTVSLVNPFSAPLHITKISSTVKSFGIVLGTIETNVDLKSAPNSTTESPTLDLNMNFDPAALFTVTRALAVEAGLDVDPLDGIVDLGGIKYLSITGEPPKLKRRANVFDGFELPKFVNAAFKKLQSDVELNVDVAIGDYKTTLQYTQSGVPTSTDESLDLILPVLAQPIVQKIVGGSTLGIENVLITDPKQTAFSSHLKGNIGNAGPFDAVISFPSGLIIDWASQTLGKIKMADVQVTGDVGAPIDATSSFEVADVAHLTEFTKVLLNEESFEWNISGENLSVNALGINVPGITLSSRSVTLKGFNGLKGGVKIKTFDLPSNDPAGGIHLTLDATTENPSQVGISVTSIGFDTYIGDILIAPVVSTGAVSLAPGSTSDLSLVGRLVPQSSAAGLSAVSGVFNNFVAGKDSDVEVRGASASPNDVTWLNEGIKSLRVASILPNRGAQDIIKSIALRELQLFFTEDTAYNPSASSRSTDAAFTLPFAFPLDITSLEQTLNVAFEGTSFAQLVVPKSPSTTDVKNRIIHLTFDGVPFAVFSNQHPTFDRFVAETTVGKSLSLQLSGSATAQAKTAVGILSLEGIHFSVDASIDGLQGLNAKPVSVSNVDVNHGFTDYLLIKASSSLFNPSNLTIGTGDVSFSLEFQDQTVGVAEISDLVIKPGSGNYSIDVHYAPQGSAVSAGHALLKNFVEGVDVDTTIAGTTGSTPISSLKSALSQIRLSPATLPGLKGTLIKSASLSFPTDIVKTGVAATSFTIANPFTAGMSLLKVGATATYHGILLGKINNVDASSHPIHADGHSSVTSPTLPLEYNLDPLATIQLLSVASEANGVDLGPLNQLFQFVVQNPDFKPPVVTSVDTNAPTDKTALYLIGAVAGPVTQHLVDGSNLKFTEANITNITNDGFDLSLAGSLTNVGPLDAMIEFTEPLLVEWQGQMIATIALPPVSTSKLRLTALGTIFDDVKLSKVLTFKAFNGLPGVTISNFLLPSDDPAGGIHIETDAMIPSPAQLGMDLGSITFQSFFQDTQLGPLSGDNVFLAAGVTSKTHLSGRIIPQSRGDLDNLGVLFSNFLAGKDQKLTTKGDSVQPSGSDGPVTWLSTAFKTLSLEVTLPGQKSDIIQSIALNDLSLILQTPEQAFAPPASSQFTLAKYKNPFGFSLQVVEAGQTLVMNSGGVDIAQLTLPKKAAVGGVSTGNVADLVISFEDVPLKALNPTAFAQMFAAVTLLDDLELTLKGTADVTAKTSSGNVPISGIPFNVPSSLKGINSFGHSAILTNVSVTGSGGEGGSEYIISPLTTTLQNPSNVTIKSVANSLPVLYKGTKIGRSVIDPFNLNPGENTFATEFHYMPDNTNDTTAQEFLGQFMQSGDQLPLMIHGDSASSPIASLSPGLAQLQLATSLTGLNQPNFITHITVTITLETLVNNLVSVNFDVHNPLDADLVIEFVQSDSGVNGVTYAHFEQPFSSFVVPAGQSANSGDFPNVLLTQGAIASLDIIPLEYLDVSARNTVRVGGAGGYLVPWLPLEQTKVPTTYNLALSAVAMKAKAKAITASSSASAVGSSTKASGASATEETKPTSAPAASSSVASDPVPASSSPAENSEPKSSATAAPSNNSTSS
ncbi:hypothetical protein H0H87_007110 [Tephrocybe sp. NHM501043]|nr:hypothetical protein H0H87_007110 [Tephrocybe sp. NHM501043]